MCGCFHSSNCAIHNSQYISYSYTDVVHVWRGSRPYTRPTNALKNLPVASRSKIYRFCRSSRQVTGQVRSWVLTVDLHIRTWPVFPRDVGLPDLRNELPIRQGFRKLSSDRHTYRETRPKLYTTPLGGWSINLYWRSSSRSVRVHTVQLMRSLACMPQENLAEVERPLRLQPLRGTITSTAQEVIGVVIVGWAAVVVLSRCRQCLRVPTERLTARSNWITAQCNRVFRSGV